MKQLCDGRFVPLTFTIGFLNRPLKQVCESYLQWTRQHFKDVDGRPIQGGLASGLAQLGPLVTPYRRILFLSTQSEWTAYFDNGVRGSDPLTPISFLAEKLGCRGLIATAVPHTLESEVGESKGVYGAVQFELFGAAQKEFLNYDRSISVAYEAGKWRFDAHGEIQPFETVDRYTDRAIKGRFTSEMLESYCQAVGVRLFDEAFYCGPGMLIVIHDPPPAGSREVSLIGNRSHPGEQ